MSDKDFDEPVEENSGEPDSPVVEATEELLAEGCWYQGRKYNHGSRICWGGKVHVCSRGSWVNIGKKC